jgi:hypothetical protein
MQLNKIEKEKKRFLGTRVIGVVKKVGRGACKKMIVLICVLEGIERPRIDAIGSGY